jgi:2-keto-4-pentenoate hydratase/2-oxohepta-3-ene-1,7-dioic acid hydratase in catechol pathway
MKLVTFASAAGPRAGLLHPEGVIDLGRCDAALPGSVRGLLEAGETVLAQLRRIEKAPPREAMIAGATLLAPIADPRIILSCGMNYREHLHEMNTPVPATPASFTKSVASIIGTGEAIRLPASHPDMVDWEGEFSVVIGRPCHRVNKENALDHVAGYTLVNDVSARDWVAAFFASEGRMQAINAWEHNLLGKMLPTFCPMGPVVVTADELGDPGNLPIQTRVNGEVMQSSNTNDLVFDVATLIAYYSQFYQLMPGDIITTGSPSGVGYGMKPQRFLRDGDVVEVEVKGIGILRNPVKR